MTREASVALATWLLVNAVPGLAGGDPARQPAPPASPLVHHDPDQQTCRPERLLQAWQRQLQGYGDQSAAVIGRLQALQRDLATASLNRCLSRGLLSREQARELAARMGLDSGRAADQPDSNQRP